MGGCGRDVNCSTIMTYDCLGTENPSNNPVVGTVGPRVETETGLTPEHNSGTELLEAALPRLTATANVHTVFTVIFSGRPGDCRTSGDIGRYATTMSSALWRVDPR